MFNTMKLGRRKPDPHRKRVMLLKHINRSNLPPIPTEWDGTLDCSFKMFGNQKKGDCVLAAVGNRGIMRAKLDSISLSFDEDAVVALYDQLSPADEGLVPHQAFEFLLKNGFPAGGNYPFVARCGIDPADLESLRLACFLFGGVLVGAELPLTSQQSGLWTGAGSDADAQPGSWGGHEMCLGGFFGDRARLITWGTTQDADWAWISRYVDDVEVLLDARHLAMPGVDGAALLTEMQALATAGDFDTSDITPTDPVKL